METFHRILVFVHVIAGFTALCTGLMAMLTAKGGREHRSAGKIYFWAMAVSCFTAAVAGVLFQKWFFFFLAFISFESAARGYRILYRKQLKEKQAPDIRDWLLVIVNALMSAGLVGWGVRIVLAGGAFGFVAMVFGALGIFVSYDYYRTFHRKSPDPKHWLRMHIRGMAVSYIAATTAFLVNNDAWLKFIPPVLLWLLPTIIGVPVMLRVMRKYKPAAKAEE
ncbi:MAG: hypothetical protein MUC87_16385 [Bacteroidia bacterium]|jgi:uncharacterized membrane protein|nr:hypothetical protein [Bacteroidia bacterium]